MKKFILRVIPVILVAIMILTDCTMVSAANRWDPLNQDPIDNTAITTLDKGVNRVWNTATTVLQVLAIACVVFAGVKYMFASAEGKADIKSGMLGLVVGAILVFGASTIIKFVIKAGSEVTNGLT